MSDFRPGDKVLLLDGGSHIGTVTGAFGSGWFVNFGGKGDAWLVADSIKKLSDDSPELRVDGPAMDGGAR